MTSAAPTVSTRVSKDGRTATVSVPVSFLQRAGRKQIISPPGAAPWSAAPRVDSALVKAVVRAHRWREMLESGEYASSAELAKAQNVGFRTLRCCGRGVTALRQGSKLALLLMMDRGSLGDLLKQLLLPHSFPRDLAG
jgi:hypothetical protein